MRDKDGLPCGLRSNERSMSSTVMAFSHAKIRARQKELDAIRRAEDPEGYRRKKAEYKRRERAKKAELHEVFESYGYQ